MHAIAEGGSVQTLYQDWLLGASPSDANLLQYAIGGALGPSSQGAPVLPAVTTTQLSMTAIVRINDPNLYVIGQSTTDLTNGTWSAADVVRTVPSDQTGAVLGTTQRQIFTTPLGAGPAKFLRLQTILQGQSTYQDDFSTNPGALDGRTTANGFGNWTTTDSAFQVGDGQITINSNTPFDYHAATFALPTLGTTDTLSLSITVRPSGPTMMAFGFTPNSGQYVQNNGYNWIYFASGNPTIQFLRGPGPTGLSYDAPLTHQTLGFDASLPTTFQYTYSASAKTLTIIASNGGNSSTLLNNLDVSTTPLSGYSNFALQFQGQTLGTDTNPAYVDSLKVEIIPAQQAP